MISGITQTILSKICFAAALTRPRRHTAVGGGLYFCVIIYNYANLNFII